MTRTHVASVAASTNSDSACAALGAAVYLVRTLMINPAEDLNKNRRRLAHLLKPMFSMRALGVEQAG